MKKILSLLLAGTMLFSFAACGEETEEKEKSKNNADIVEDGGVDIGDENNDVVVDFADTDFTDTQVGDYITFGSYEQDDDTSNGKEPIEWLVLDKQDGRILVISKYGLDSKEYHNELENVTWETCTVRSWLNGDFINTTFTEREVAKIATVTVTADVNPKYSTSYGDETEDKVFYLNIDEVNKYFNSNNIGECKPTKYAVAQGCYCHNISGYEGICRWWLRSPGSDQSYVTNVTSIDNIDYFGDRVDTSNYYAVRPAMWIEL